MLLDNANDIFLLSDHRRKTLMKLLRLLTAGVVGLEAGMGGGGGCAVGTELDSGLEVVFLAMMESRGSDFLFASLISLGF